MRLGRLAVLAAIAGGLMLVACAEAVEREGNGAGSGPTPEPTDSPERTEWVAVFHVAADPNDLDRDTEELRRVAGDNTVVGPLGCHDGLAEELDASDANYFSGVVADTREELDAAIERAQESPLFQDDPVVTGEFRLLCGL